MGRSESLRGYQGTQCIELTGASDFGEEREDIIVLTLLNPPEPVTFIIIYVFATGECTG